MSATSDRLLACSASTGTADAAGPSHAADTTDPASLDELADAGLRVDLHTPVLTWFDVHGRDLPWRRPGTTAWEIFVCEVMSQQTPLPRVEPAWREWVTRWPDPAALAAAAPGEAIRAWGRLGYPRRALRLHAAAEAMVREHDGAVPEDYDALLTLPGVGPYTAAAVAAFAHGRRTCVVDTNVRRVQARAVTGAALPAPTLTVAESRLAASLVPAEPLPAAQAVRWNVAIMELGALVCTARTPACSSCPIHDRCAWQAAGAPAPKPRARGTAAWHGTDRQARGALLERLRQESEPVRRDKLLAAWPHDPQQARRCLSSLVQDGLAEGVDTGCYALPR